MKDSIIRRPSDAVLRRALEMKLGEYAVRVQLLRERFPDESLDQIGDKVSDVYKLALLEQILDEGQIDSSEFLTDLLNHGNVNIDNYFNASFIIRNYCEKGGADIVGGTGLPLPGNEAKWRAARDKRFEEYSRMK